MRVGVVHHLGWAVAVAADDDHGVVDRRRIELVDPGLPGAPVHHEGGTWELHRTGDLVDDGSLAELVARVRASALRRAGEAFDGIVAALGESVASVSVADWPDHFPTDVATLRRPPHESRADSVMYRQVLAEATVARGWPVHRYDPRTVVVDATTVLGERAEEVLHGPRRALGPPWTKDHRTALAATVVAAG